jgi:DNA-binding response OmpR family regulator
MPDHVARGHNTSDVSEVSSVRPTEPEGKQRAAQWPPRGPVRLLMMLDRPTMIDMIRLTLNHGVYMTRSAATPLAGIAIVDEWQPHLVIFDADLDGQQVMQHIASKATAGGRLPAIALTRRGDLRTKLAAFEWGVDDILTIPFAPEEMLARVVALLRRSYTDAVTFTPVIHLGDLEIDILNRTVRVGQSELHLTSLEQSLLYLLAANAGRVVTREEILDTLWGVDYVAESNVVDRQIRNLRARLQNDWKRPRFIATIPGRGYRFLPTFSDDPPDAREAPEVGQPGPASRARPPEAGSRPGWRRVRSPRLRLLRDPRRGCPGASSSAVCLLPAARPAARV